MASDGSDNPGSTDRGPDIQPPFQNPFVAPSIDDLIRAIFDLSRTDFSADFDRIDPGIFSPTMIEIESNEPGQIDPHINDPGSSSQGPSVNDPALVNRGGTTSGGTTTCRNETPDDDVPLCPS
jgi:hypothetical protein